MDKEYFTKRLTEIEAALQQLTVNYNMLMGKKIEVQATLVKIEAKEKEDSATQDSNTSVSDAA